MKHACLVALCLLLTSASGCAYRHFLGMHGPSVQDSLAIHQGISDDADCLDCHDPKVATEAPPTTHPSFSGCLKCHNDKS